MCDMHTGLLVSNYLNSIICQLICEFFIFFSSPTCLDQWLMSHTGKSVNWYRPATLDQFLELKSQFPSAKIVVGNTEVTFKKKYYFSVQQRKSTLH